MDICRVRYFLAVCERGSFTATARACGVSQPSVTTGVRRLERDIGGLLFERRHPIRLMALGEKLRPLLQELQAVVDRVSAEAELGRRSTGSAAAGIGIAGRTTRDPKKPSPCPPMSQMNPMRIRA